MRDRMWKVTSSSGRGVSGKNSAVYEVVGKRLLLGHHSELPYIRSTLISVSVRRCLETDIFYCLLSDTDLSDLGA